MKDERQRNVSAMLEWLQELTDATAELPVPRDPITRLGMEQVAGWKRRLEREIENGESQFDTLKETC